MTTQDKTMLRVLLQILVDFVKQVQQRLTIEKVLGKGSGLQRKMNFWDIMF